MNKLGREREKKRTDVWNETFQEIPPENQFRIRIRVNPGLHHCIKSHDDKPLDDSIIFQKKKKKIHQTCSQHTHAANTCSSHSSLPKIRSARNSPVTKWGRIRSSHHGEHWEVHEEITTKQQGWREESNNHWSNEARCEEIITKRYGSGGEFMKTSLLTKWGGVREKSPSAAKIWHNVKKNRHWRNGAGVQVFNT